MNQKIKPKAQFSQLNLITNKLKEGLQIRDDLSVGGLAKTMKPDKQGTKTGEHSKNVERTAGDLSKTMDVNKMLNVKDRMGSFIMKKMTVKKEIDYKMKYIARREDIIGLLCQFSKEPYKQSLKLELISPKIYNKIVP